MSSGFFMKRFLQKRRRRKERNLNNYENSLVTDIVENNENKIVEKCRVCMKDAFIPIYNQENSFDISEAIRMFGGVELSEDDNFPKHICITCHDFLKNALLFRNSAQDTDKTLRQTSIHENNDFDAVNDDVDDNVFDSHESNSKSYNCELCKLQFQSPDDLLAHNSSKSHKSIRVQCPICLGLLTAQLYKKHLERHQSASHLVCDICGKLYRKDNLIRHLQLHNYELPFQCQICPYRGRFMESLKIHMRTHTGDKPFSCDKCELRFLTRSNLNRHLLTHKKERPFKCIECGRGFYIKRDLDSHFKADHVGLNDYNCRMCGNKYGTRKALMRHELRVHKRDKMAKGRMPLYLQAEYQKQGDEEI